MFLEHEFDITIADPQHSRVPVALRRVPGGAAKAAGEKKTQDIQANIDGIDSIRFAPLPLETSGALSHGFSHILSRVAKKTAERMGADARAEQSLFRLATQRISVALQGAQATILQRRAGARAATYLRSDRRRAPTYTDLLMVGMSRSISDHILSYVATMNLMVFLVVK